MSDVLAYWPFIAIVLPVVLSLVYKLLEQTLKGKALEGVAGAYRVAIRAAVEFQGEGIDWLRGPQGILLRQRLADAAYDCLPSTIWGIPVGLVKLVVSREWWRSWVEEAFDGVCDLAEDLEYPLSEKTNS